MNNSILLIGLFILVILILPFILMTRHQKGKRKKKMEAFKHFVSQQGINLSEFDVINDLVIGIDQAQKKLISSSLVRMEGDFSSFDLENFNACEVKKSAPQGAEYQWVSLELKGKGKKESFMFLEDNTDELPKRDYYTCIADAQKWAKLIQPHLA